MPDVFRTLIVTASELDLARSIAAIFPGGQGMWITPLSATGQEPATHNISSGYVPEGYQNMVPCQTWDWDSNTQSWIMVSSTLGDPVAVYNAAIQAGIQCTQDDINMLFATSDVTEQEPFVAMGRLGLQLIQQPIISTGITYDSNS